MPTRVLIQRLDPGLPLPSRGNPGDAGWDLFAREDAHLTPGERLVIPTGVAIALEPGSSVSCIREVAWLHAKDLPSSTLREPLMPGIAVRSA